MTCTGVSSPSTRTAAGSTPISSAASRSAVSASVSPGSAAPPGRLTARHGAASPLDPHRQGDGRAAGAGIEEQQCRREARVGGEAPRLPPGVRRHRGEAHLRVDPRQRSAQTIAEQPLDFFQGHGCPVCSIAAMSAFPRIDPAVGRRVLELVRGCTFDDFILSPQHSVLDAPRSGGHRSVAASSPGGITLKRPIVSANMDTVTRAPMAIVQAEEGGIGIIDRGFRPGEIEPQVREVEIVKRTQHGVITDPYARRRRRHRSIEAAAHDAALAASARWWSSTTQRRLAGLLTERDVRFVTRPRLACRRSHDAARPRWSCIDGPLALAGRRAADGRAQGQEAAARRRGRHAASA